MTHWLYVEDNLADVVLSRLALEEVNPDVHLHSVEDGEEALDFLSQRGEFVGMPRPSLILLDLGLPGIGGIETLRRIRQCEGSRDVPVVVVSNWLDDRQLAECHRLQANECVTKPAGLAAIKATLMELSRRWLK